MTIKQDIAYATELAKQRRQPMLDLYGHRAMLETIYNEGA